MTVLMAEHRLERVVQYADRVVLVPGGGRAGRRRRARRGAGDRAGRAAGRRAGPARGLVAAAAVGARRPPPGRRPARAAARRADPAGRAGRRRRTATWSPRPRGARRRGTLRRRRGRCAARRRPAAAGRRGRRPDGPQRRRQVDAAVGPGRAAPPGRRHGHGRRRRTRTRCAPRDLVRRVGHGAAGAGRPALRRHGGRRVRRGRPGRGRAAGHARSTLLAAARRPASTRHATRATCPRASGSRSRSPSCWPAGRRWCCSTSRPAASTTPARRRWCVVLRELAADGHAVVLATHDVELAATVADRTVVLADGEVVSDGPSREVVVSSPAFAPQVAKVLAPLPWLTVAEVAAVAAGRRMTDRLHRAERRSAAVAAAARGPRSPSPWSAPVGLLAFCWPLFVQPGAALAGTVRRAVAVRRCCCRCCSRSCWPRSPTAAWTPSRSPCSACWPRSARRCGRSAAASPGFEPVFFLLVLAGRALGPRLRLRARVGDAVRLGAAHRRRRAVAAVPDARRRLGRLPRRLPAAGHRAARGRAARGVRRGRRARLRRADEPLALAVHHRAGQQHLLRRRRPADREPGPVPRRSPWSPRWASTSRGRSPTRCSSRSPARPVLLALRRAARRAEFEAVPTFAPPVTAPWPGDRPSSHRRRLAVDVDRPDDEVRRGGPRPARRRTHRRARSTWRSGWPARRARAPAAAPAPDPPAVLADELPAAHRRAVAADVRVEVRVAGRRGPSARPVERRGRLRRPTRRWPPLLAGAALADEEVDAGADLLVLALPDPDLAVPAATLVGLLTRSDASAVTATGQDDAAWMVACAATRDAMRRGRPADGRPGRPARRGGRGRPRGRDRAAAAGGRPAYAGGAGRTGHRRAAALVAARLSFRAPDWWLAGTPLPGPGAPARPRPALARAGARPRAARRGRHRRAARRPGAAGRGRRQRSRSARTTWSAWLSASPVEVSTTRSATSR